MTRPTRFVPHRAAPLALILVLGLLLAACGGDGGGGGGGGGAVKLRVAVVNQTQDTIQVSLDGAEPGTPMEVEKCDAQVFTLDQPDSDWTLTVDGKPAIESVNLEANMQARNLIAQVRLNKNGELVVDNLSAGSSIQTPSKLGICS